MRQIVHQKAKGMKKKTNRIMPTIRVYDFFSGCGGTSVGFLQAGIKNALAIDSCPDAIRTFQKSLDLCKRERGVQKLAFALRDREAFPHWATPSRAHYERSRTSNSNAKEMPFAQVEN